MELEAASYELERRLRDVAGAIVETKGVSLSVHYRLVAEAERAPRRADRHARSRENAPGLRLTTGKLVYELSPDLGWDKGKAMLWLLKRLRLQALGLLPPLPGRRSHRRGHVPSGARAGV